MKKDYLTLSKTKVLLILSILFTSLTGKAQTTLSPGEIMMTCFNTESTQDGFTFVILRNINSGTAINFTDIGWDPSANNWGGVTGISEVYFTWTASGAMNCGSEVSISATGSGITATSGTITGINGGPNLNLSSAGESILAYQGTHASPSFITGFTNYISGWTWNSGLALTSCGLPSSLTNGTNAMSFPDIDNWKYNCNTTAASASTLRSLLANSSNWISDDTTPYAFSHCITGCSSPLTANITSSTNVSCNGGSNGSATVTASGGTSPYTYSWAPSGGTGATTTGRTAGSYTVTVTDAASATATATVTITQPTAISTSGSQTNVSCFGGSNGSITVAPFGGTPGYTYSWAPSGGTSATASGRSAGTYTVTVTDANGCTATRTYTLTQPSSPVSGFTAVTNVACFGGSNGAINLTPSGGTPGYTYNWGSGITSEDRTGLAAGTYTVVITDANGCTGTVTTSVTQPSSPVSGSTVVTNVACFGGSNGAINLTPSGGTPGYTYNWGSGITTEDRTSLAAGTYTVVITDANSCTGTVTASVTQPSSPVSGSTVVTNVACFGGSNGAINLTPSGGTPGYTYNWGSGITTEDRTGLAAGTYTVVITDANSCTGTVTASVTQPSSPVSGSTVVTNVACFGGSNGAINLTPSGGTPGYTYNWGSGITTEDRTGLAAGTYTVVITDANSCTGTVTASITQPSSPVSGST
ncbi:MAG: hypothetical protein ACK40G_12495, partial [Cytophagaceae bacterium]